MRKRPIDAPTGIVTPGPALAPTSVTTTPESSAPQYLSHRQILVVLTGLMAGMFLAALDQSIVGVALPTIVSELGGLEHLSWVVTVYLLTSTASTPLWGKVSDLYGRRPMFQAAIVAFLIGSTGAALAGSMTTLIAGRAVQGLGAGGLIALALTIIGDVVPPRERGRYQGFFGVVFGVSSVAGPLLGGWFTDGPGWRWIFWINLPIGVAALAVTSAALRMAIRRRQHSIDYLGAATIVAAVTTVLLYTSWAGAAYGWLAPLPLALLAAGLVLTAAFVAVERRASEPILPPHLFANSIFRWSTLYGALMGLAMFGVIIFLPVYLQVVQGMSPTMSGLALIPMMAGIFTTSIGSGQAITRTGRYRAFPILGAATVTAALLLLSGLGAQTPYWQVALYVFVFGAGLGFTMQVVVTVVQNAVDFRDLGTATSAVAFFRSMGGAFGTALFGAVLNARLTHHLGENLTGGRTAAAPAGDIASNVQAIQGLPEQLRVPVVQSFVEALHDVFLSAVPILLLAVAVAFLIEERPLRGRESAQPEEAVPTPVD